MSTAICSFEPCLCLAPSSPARSLLSGVARSVRPPRMSADSSALCPAALPPGAARAQVLGPLLEETGRQPALRLLVDRRPRRRLVRSSDTSEGMGFSNLAHVRSSEPPSRQVHNSLSNRMIVRR